MTNILKIAFIYTGTILGAGFATGKELVTFFAILNKKGIFSFLLACLLLALCCISILGVIYKTKAKTYQDFMHSIFGRFGKYIQIFNLLLLFVLFSAMLAGGGATICSMFNINHILSIFIFCVLTFLALIYGKKAIVSVNTILCPILIIGGILIGVYLQFSTISVFNNNVKAVILPFIYTSYNAITTISVLFSIKHLISSKKIIVFSSLLGGMFIFFIGLSMLIPLINNIDYIKDESLPILILINKDIVKNIYSTTVLCAIFTTAVSNGVALQDSIKTYIKIKPIYIKISIILLGVMFSSMGFSKIVSVLYPIFGYIGMFELIVIILMFLSNSIDK